MDADLFAKNLFAAHLNNLLRSCTLAQPVVVYILCFILWVRFLFAF